MPPPGYPPFLRAICENPEDDTVRLVYADWLDENGDPDRAEFIRVSIEYARQCTLAGFNREVFTRYAAAFRNIERWKSELPKLQAISWAGAFHRGFTHEIAVSSGRHLLRQREAAFESTPIDSLSLADAGLATLTRVLELPEMNRISHLWLPHCRLAPGQWGVVAACPLLSRLNFLGLARPYQPQPGTGQPLLTETDAHTLAASPFLARGLKLQLHGWVSVPAAALLRSRFAEVIVGSPPPGGHPV